MLRIATAVFLLSPVVAQAQCLTPEALDTGITITFGNGNLSYIQRTASGSILDAYDNQQSYYKEIILLETLDGVIELSRVSHEKDRWSPVTSGRMAYDFAVETLAPYMPGTRGGGSATRLRPDYRDAPKAVGWSAFERAPLLVGECSYQATQVFITEFDSRRGDLYAREITYLPELGFGIQRANSYYNLPLENATILSMSAD